MKIWNKKHIVLVALFSGMLAFGQGPVRDKIKTLKVAFITEQLQLSSKEAQSFWPVYNAHEEQSEKFRRKERLDFGGKLANLSSLSDSEASTLLSDYLGLQEQKQELQQEFVRELKGVISDRKIILLLKAEEDFKKRLLQQYRKRRAGG